MNLASLLRWSRRILASLARGTAGGSVTERTRARCGWMEHYRAVLTEWPDSEGLSPEMIMDKLGRPGVHPEGRFYPDSGTLA